MSTLGIQATMKLTAARATAGRRAAALAIGCVALSMVTEARHPTLPASFELSRAVGGAVEAARWHNVASSAVALIAVCAFVQRTFSRRTAAYAFAVLATTPIWFVSERAATGAMAPMAAAAFVFAALGLAVFDPTENRLIRAFAIAVALGAAGLAGHAGLFVVVGIPALAVGAASFTQRSPLGLGAAAVGALLGLASIVVTLAPSWAFAGTGTKALTDLLLGAANRPVTPPTFEAPVAALAYGLAPWSPFVPFALATRPKTAAHLAVILAAVMAIAAASLLAPRLGTDPASSPAMGAAAVFLVLAVAGSFASLDRSTLPLPLLAVAVFALTFLVVHDLHDVPARMLTSFVDPHVNASSPADAFGRAATPVLGIVRLSICAHALAACAALTFPSSWLPVKRGMAIVVAGALAGFASRAAAYPSLLARLSPSAVVDAWHAHRAPVHEPLGLLHVDPTSVAASAEDAVLDQPDAQGAARWLTSATSSRRFLALSASSGDLARVNADYRSALGANARNVPVLVGGEESTFLLASALAADEESQNPLDRIVLDAAPNDLKRLDAMLDDRIDAVGWELTDDDGQVLQAISRSSRHAHLRVVLRPRDSYAQGETRGFCTFLHIDHTPSRFAAEHKELPYPMDLWHPGDTIVDDYDVTLPAHFSHGHFQMYWGFGRLPCTDDRRMTVSAGPSDGHGRVMLGTVTVQ